MRGLKAGGRTETTDGLGGLTMTQHKLLGGWSKAAVVLGIAALAGLSPIGPSRAADKVVKVGITLPLTGADAEDATLIKNGALMAIEEANAKGAVPGYKIEA